MVSGLFKPGWQSDSAQKRARAIEAMDPQDSELQPIIQSLAQDDPDQAVRRAALHQLNNIELLFKWSIEHPQTESRPDAEHAFALLLNNSAQKDEKSHEDGLRTLWVEHPDMTLGIAKHASLASIRNEVILSLSIEQQAGLIADIGYVDSRQLIAEQLEEEEHLLKARNLLSGKDKNAEKIIRAKLDSIHAKQRQEQENQAAALVICEKIEYLAEHELRNETKAQHSIWSQRWQELDFAVEQEISQRYLKAAKQLEAALNQQAESQNALQQQQTLASELMQACYALAKHSWQELGESRQASLERLNSSAEQWKTAAEIARPETSVVLQFEHASESLTGAITFSEKLGDKDDATVQGLNGAITKFKWPEQYPEFAAKAEAQLKLDQLKQEQAADKKSKAEKLDKLHKRINRLLGSTKKGDLARAKRELTAITKTVSRYEGKDRTALDERVKQADEAVTKMSDWVDFATEPKLLELCQQMEACIGSKLHADKLAEKINKLQQGWKALDHCVSSDKHWPRFKEAADKAYEPCAVFFKQRRKTRQQNLKKREPFLSQMRDLLEKTPWDDAPDYKQIEANLQRIHNGWQKIKDVEQGAGQKQWNRLTKIRSEVYQKLDVVYDANIELKNQLIAQTQAMLDSELKEDSLGKLQLYQSRWKQVGVTRRKQDQAAWKKFKTASDAVYQKIQEVRQARRSKEDEKLDAYRKISRNIQNLAKQATELSVADAQFEQLEADYKALPELPKELPEKLLKGLASDYRRATDAYSHARQRIKGNAQKKQGEALAKKAALCAQIEQLGANHDAAELEELQEAMVEIEISNRSLAKQFEQRVKAALDPDRSTATKARRLFCIDLEILLGVDSPAEDSSQRMQIQLERMKSKGIGHAQKYTAETINKAKQDWLCMPGAEAGVQQDLDERFAKLIKSK